MNGKGKCKILRQIRREIAQKNDIEYVTSECKFQGKCTGTCPKCEAEVQYLEAELAKRRKAGKAVAVAGIAAALVLSTAGCGPDDLLSPEKNTVPQTEGGDYIIFPGAVPVEETLTDGTEPLTEEILLGDVPFPG